MGIDAALVAVWVSGVVLSRRLFRDIFTPLCIYVSVWCACLLLFRLKLIEYERLTSRTWVLIGSSMLAFAAGCLLARVTGPRCGPGPRREVKVSPYKLKAAIQLLTLADLAGLLIFLVHISASFSLSEYFTDPGYIREMVGSPARLGFLFALLLCAYPLFALSVLYCLESRRIGFFSALGALLPLVQTYFTTDRVSLVLYLITALLLWIYVHGWSRLGRRVLPALVVAVTLAVGYFVGVGHLYGELSRVGSNTFRSSYLNAPDGWERKVIDPYLYATGDFPALQEAIADTDARMWGVRTFYPVARLMYSFGALKNRPEEARMTFYFIPIAFNTYTYLLGFYEDFGTVGLVGIPVLLGFLETILYLRMKSRPTLFSVLGTSAFMAVNVFSVFIALCSSYIVWYFLFWTFLVSEICAGRQRRLARAMPVVPRLPLAMGIGSEFPSRRFL